MRLLANIFIGLLFVLAFYLGIRPFILEYNANFGHVSSVNNSVSRYIPFKSDLEFVRIHLANNKTEDIPLFVFLELFSLPPDFLCSSTQVIDATNSHVVMKSFFVGCCKTEFCTFLFSLHQFVTESSSKVPRDDSKITFSVACKFINNARLMNWLNGHIEGKKCNCSYTTDILQQWDSDYQFAYPVVFLNDLSYESDKEHISLTLRDLKSVNHSSKIGSGSFSTCFQVNFKCPYQGQPDFQSLVFKRFKDTNKSNWIVEQDFRELSILQRGEVTSRKKYNVPYSLVVKSSSNFTPIGYLIEMAEHGDLIKFLTKRPYALFTKYFIEQLFELAEAINNLHKHDIFHLDIAARNIFVRKPTPNSHNAKNNYELILGDFGLSAMKKWNAKGEGNFKEHMHQYPPEFFLTFPGKIPCDSYSDFYMFGIMLNSLITIFNDPVITAKIGYFFSYLINCTCTFHPEQRWNFTEVEKFFNYILENHDPNMCVMRHPHDKDGKVPTWFYKPENSDPNSDYSTFVKEYKASNFEYVHFIIDATNPNQALPKQVHGKPAHVKSPIAYEFQCDYLCAISLPQTNNQKKYFFRKSLLIFEPDVFCYAEFYYYNGNDIKSTIATYNYLEIVEKINFGKIEYIKRIE